MFDLTQELQKVDRDQRQKIYARVKEIDVAVDQDQALVMKIRDKEVRKELMESILAFKMHVSGFYNLAAQDTKQTIDNVLIAQLNDFAYKAVRKTGLNKKLDERALKNETYFKSLSDQLDKTAEKIDVKNCAEKYKNLVEEIGCCPLSQMDVFELLEQKDCMCLGLDIARSEAAIADPSKLVIRKVLPVFMSLDAFLESSIFHLK